MPPELAVLSAESPEPTAKLPIAIKEGKLIALIGTFPRNHIDIEYLKELLPIHNTALVVLGRNGEIIPAKPGRWGDNTMVSTQEIDLGLVRQCGVAG